MGEICSRCIEFHLHLMFDGMKTIFSYHDDDGRVYAWDATKAASIAHDGRPVYFMDFEESLLTQLGGNEIVDEHVSHVDVGRPCIVVETMLNGMMGHLMIDGNHRAMLRKREGLRFEYLLLEPAEAAQCLVINGGSESDLESILEANMLEVCERNNVTPRDLFDAALACARKNRR